jgi:Tfp pilus assembly protein PilF
VHYHLALIYKHRGELNRAAAFFQRALEVQPNDRDARNWLDRMDAFAAEQEELRRRPRSQNPLTPPGAEDAAMN